MRDLQREVEDRLRKASLQLNDYGYDPFGFNPDFASHMVLPVAMLYRYYFRAETHGIERVPEGRVLLIANHAGNTFAWDGAMLAMSMLLEAEPPRMLRGMVEYFLPQIPYFTVLMHRAGSVVGTPENCVHMLENEECVMVFPEGVRGLNKAFGKRYELQRFGLGFMRLALETGAPIVPVGIVGSEEQQPGLLNLESLGRVFGLPSIPITIGSLLLGPLGLLPLPVKYRIYFGEPMHFDCDPNDEEAVIEAEVARVKQAISALLERGRAEREGIFS